MRGRQREQVEHGRKGYARRRRVRVRDRAEARMANFRAAALEWLWARRRNKDGRGTAAKAGAKRAAKRDGGPSKAERFVAGPSSNWAKARR
jgi:hypothetical protein